MHPHGWSDLKRRVTRPPHSFLFTLHLEKISWTDFRLYWIEKDQHSSFIPILSSFITYIRRPPVHFPRKSSPLHFSLKEHTRYSQTTFLSSFARLIQRSCKCLLIKFLSWKLFFCESSIKAYEFDPTNLVTLALLLN